MKKVSLSCPSSYRRGFTLVEMSVVLVIMGLVLATVYPALQTLRAANQRSLTEAHLDSLMKATAAYLFANGCLPCPTPANASTTGLGRVRGDSSASPAACTATTASCYPEGIPPFASLGLPAALAQDGWGHWITMRVDPYLTSASLAIVPPNAPCTDADTTLSICSSDQKSFRQKGFCKAGLKSLGTPITVQSTLSATQYAAVLFVSHGADGYGAFRQNQKKTTHPSFPADSSGSVPTCTTRSEVCNADDDATFKIDYQSPDPLVQFDDLFQYADRNALVTLLGGQACETTW